MTNRQRLTSALDALTDYLYDTGGLKARDPREPGRRQKQRGEARLQAVVQRHFRRQRAAIVHALEVFAPQQKAAPRGVDESLWRAVLDAADDDAFNAPLTRILTEEIQNGVRLFADEVGFDLDYTLVNVAAAKWARRYAGEFIKGIDKTTLEAVRAAVQAFVETAGMTMGDVVKQLPFDEDRSWQVATTEVTRSYAEAAMLAGQEMHRQYPDVRVVKRWNTNVDDRVCPRCAPLDGEEIDINESFSSGDDIPPAHVSCRCWLSTRTKIND